MPGTANARKITHTAIKHSVPAVRKTIKKGRKKKKRSRKKKKGNKHLKKVLDTAIDLAPGPVKEHGQGMIHKIQNGQESIEKLTDLALSSTDNALSTVENTNNLANGDNTYWARVQAAALLVKNAAVNAYNSYQTYKTVQGR